MQSNVREAQVCGMHAAGRSDISGQTVSRLSRRCNALSRNYNIRERMANRFEANPCTCLHGLMLAVLMFRGFCSFWWHVREDKTLSSDAVSGIRHPKLCDVEPVQAFASA